MPALPPGCILQGIVQALVEEITSSFYIVMKLQSLDTDYLKKKKSQKTMNMLLPVHGEKLSFKLTTVHFFPPKKHLLRITEKQKTYKHHKIYSRRKKKIYIYGYI